MIKIKSFPIPVLGNSDDFNGNPAIPALLHTSSAGKILFEFDPRLLNSGNAAINNCVSKKEAQWFLRIHCARTFFRKEYPLDDQDPKIEINSDLLDGAVVCELFIIATSKINNYKPDKINQDYGATTFNVEKGMVLGVIYRYKIYIEPRFDPMKADAESFFIFKEDSTNKTGSFYLDTSADKITVNFFRDEWVLINEFNSRVPDLIHSCVILPSLVEALQELEGEDEDEAEAEGESRMWVGRLRSVIAAKKLDGKDCLEKAQKVLENPTLRSLSKVQNELAGE